MKYQKRLHWDRHRPEFLKIGFIFALAIALMAFNYTSTPPILEPMDVEPLEKDVLTIPPITVHQKKKVPTPPPPQKVKPIVNIEPTDEPIIKFEPKVEIQENIDADEDVYASNPIPEPAPKVELIKMDEPIDDSPVLMAERMPIYGSCDVDLDEKLRRDCTSQNLLKHIYENVKYPALARGAEIEGTVVVSFVVNKQGNVEDVKIVRGIGGGCGKEVKRVIEKLGQFLPGKQNGRPVSVIYRLPVKFRLE